VPNRIEAENLDEIKNRMRKGHRIRHCSKNSDGTIRVVLTDGDIFHLRNVRLVEKGNHILLRDNSRDSLVIPLSATQLKSRWWRSMLFSMLGLIISVLLGFSVNFGFHWFQKPKLAIENQIKELDKIQVSLSELQEYVSSQQHTLRNLSDSLQKLKEEKSTIETILDTDRDKVKALLTYSGVRSHQDQWIQWGVAFLIGVFSSLVATLLWNYFKNIRKLAQQDFEEGPSKSGRV
jgi:hypothetical protein